MANEFDLTEKNIYFEYYGTKYEELIEFSDLCNKNGMIFCDCILGNTKDWEYFKRYLKKKYGISSQLMNRDIGFAIIGLNGPTTNKEKYNENLDKIKKIGGRIFELQEKIQKSYNEKTKVWDDIIHQ